MYYVYVLKSKNFNRYYTGQTDDINTRLLLHNNGSVCWTKRYKPWEIIYTEEYDTREESVNREKYLKSHAGRNWIKNKLGH